jgi:hypothetical protein
LVVAITLTSTGISRFAHRPHRPLLEQAQQLALRFRRHLGDLVQKQGAALGGTEQPQMQFARG